MSLPVIQLSGTPYEQGLRHGKELKDLIKHNIDLYFDYFEEECKLPREEVLTRGEKYLKAIASQSPDFFKGMRGIADGSGFGINELAAVNVRFEIIYYQLMVKGMTDGCTSFAISPNASANGHLIIGQNWDWIPGVKGAVLHTIDPDGLETLSFTEAGVFGGKIGFNTAGIGLAVNGMSTTEDDWSRLFKPFHARCYEILRSRDIDSAVRIVTGTKRSCSTNFLIAQLPDKVVDVESSPDKVRLLDPEKDLLVHTNHFLDPEVLGVTEPSDERRRLSTHRRDRLLELLSANQPVSLEDIQGHLRDHDGYPNSVCRHLEPEDSEERFETVVSVVADPKEQKLYICDGHPCTNAYQQISII